MLTISGVATPGLLAPDIGWTGTAGDFVATSTGLAASDPIRTAITMLLFTNARCEKEALRFEHGGDRRGWVGDGFSVDEARGEQALGSTLWLLRRSVLNKSVAMAAEAECVRALQPLIRQRVAAMVTAKATIAGARDRLEIAIDLLTRDGRPVFSDRFDVLWKAVS